MSDFNGFQGPTLPFMLKARVLILVTYPFFMKKIHSLSSAAYSFIPETTQGLT